MLKSDAIALHLKHWEKFPVFVWQEGGDLVTEVDGKVIRAKTEFLMDIKLDGIAPRPRNLYFVDEPDYETDRHLTHKLSGPNAEIKANTGN